MKSRMIESGIPQEISEYLIQVNRSIVKLRDEDLLDEPHRHVLFNPDGSINPNLPKEIKDRLISDPESKKDYIERGYSEYATIGVPQGAATSCGLATLNLKELFIEYKDDLTMYADDGVLSREDTETPSFTIEKAGVHQEPEKSG